MEIVSKYALKPDCVHFTHGKKCKVLNSTQTGKLNCELCRCSFYETAEAYQRRQAKFDERKPAELKMAEKLK